MRRAFLGHRQEWLVAVLAIFGVALSWLLSRALDELAKSTPGTVDELLLCAKVFGFFVASLALILWAVFLATKDERRHWCGPSLIVAGSIVLFVACSVFVNMFEAFHRGGHAITAVLVNGLYPFLLGQGLLVMGILHPTCRGNGVE